MQFPVDDLWYAHAVMRDRQREAANHRLVRPPSPRRGRRRPRHVVLRRRLHTWAARTAGRLTRGSVRRGAVARR